MEITYCLKKKKNFKLKILTNSNSVLSYVFSDLPMFNDFIYLDLIIDNVSFDMQLLKENMTKILLNKYWKENDLKESIGLIN